MTKFAFLCGLVLMGIPLLTPAKDFPLEFKTLNAQEAMSFPGSGAYGMLQTEKPAGVTREPPAVSQHPLYCQLAVESNRLWFRFDESKGDGTGYDTVLVDMNQNGVLTAAPIVQGAGPAAQTSLRGAGTATFGPIPVPDNRKLGAWRPVYFAQVFLFTPPANFGANRRGSIIGQMRFKAGWYLETAVDLDGVSRKVGIMDGNCNFRLGDSDKPMVYKNGAETNWYFQSGDYFLEDNNGSGKFENSMGDNDTAPFGPILYLGAKPYQAKLAADCQSLALEPWSGPLAILELAPHGEQVNNLQVAWEKAPGEWQLLQPGVENGKAAVPPGNYRLYTCQLKAKTGMGDALILSGYKRTVGGTITATAGAPTLFNCGAPLEIKLTCAPDATVNTITAPSSLLDRILGNSSASQSSLQQRVTASIFGAGGEMYSSFLCQGNGAPRQPPKPAFAVFSGDGKQVASENMEFG